MGSGFYWGKWLQDELFAGDKNLLGLLFKKTSHLQKSSHTFGILAGLPNNTFYQKETTLNYNNLATKSEIFRKDILTWLFKLLYSFVKKDVQSLYIL